MNLHEKYDSSIYNFLKEILRPFHWHIFGLLVVIIIWALDLSIRPYLMKIILDKLSSTPSIEVFRHLYFPIICYICMSLIVILVRRLQDIIRLNFFPNLKKNIAQQMLEYMMGHSYEYYQNHFAGSLSNKISDIINGVPQLINITIERFLSQGLGLLIAIYTMSLVDIKFAFIMFIWIFVFLSFSLTKAKRSCMFSDRASEARSQQIGKMMDILTNMISVKFFANKNYESQQLQNVLKEVVVNEQKLQWFFLKIWTVQGISYIVVQSICFWLLMQERSVGLVTTGDFALILTLNMYILDCLWNMGRDFAEFTEHFGKVTQGLRIITQEYYVSDVINAKELQVSAGKIQFKNVDFHYKGIPPLFSNKSVTIQGGEKVGLVGYSGSGKSTFVNLILRLFDIKSGQILIDDQDISKVTQESLMSAIAMIPQDSSLFHRSLMDNIRYGRVHASEEEVISASRKAYAHEFIILTPNGYNSFVGERGVKLSGGQRQRISIARAILKNTRILILDEATSAMDSVTEGYIQASLTGLMKDKTVIVIAHRLSTLLNMDRILVFDKGKIIEEGTHKQLLALNGTYATLWNNQVGGFLLDGSLNKKINESLNLQSNICT